MEWNRSEIISKIQKLLALGTSSNENEAALAAAKAREFLSKYNLDMSEIVEVDQTVQFEVEENIVQLSRMLHNYFKPLAVTVAKAFDCQVIRVRSRYGHQYVFIGIKVDSQVASYTYQFIMQEVARLAKKAVPELKAEAERNYGHSAPKTSQLKYAYASGMVTRIRETLADQSRAIQQKENCTALVVVKKDAIRRHMAEAHPHVTRQAMRQRAVESGAYNTGYADGANVSIRPGMNGARQAAISQ
jgi:hypothetical protein